MAQIANQVKSIDRLLVDGSYDAEMKILHEGAAALVAENVELRSALSALVRACTLDPVDVGGEADTALAEALSDAVTRAQELLG